MKLPLCLALLLPSIAWAGWPLESLPQGDDPSIAVDALGTTHVLSIDGDDVNYAVGAPGSWTTSVTMNVPNIRAAALSTHPVTGDAMVVASSVDGLFLTSPTLAPGLVEPLSATPMRGAAVGHFSDGTVMAVAYRNVSPRGLVSVHDTGGGTWVEQTIDPDPKGQHGSSVTIRTGTDGFPRVGYLSPIDADRAEVRFATWTGSSWTVDIVGPVAPGTDVDMALDASGEPQFIYRSTSGEVVVASESGGVWSEEPLFLPEFDELSVSIEIDGVNRHVMASGTVDPGECSTPFSESRYLINDGSGWITETVATGYDNADSALALDAFGTPLAAVTRAAGPQRLEVSERLDDGLSLEITSTDIVGIVGDSMSFRIEVTNTGTAPATFDHTYFRPRGACDNFIAHNAQVSLFSRPMTIPPRTTRGRTITRQIPRGVAWGEYQLEVGMELGGVIQTMDVAYMTLQSWRDPVTLFGTVLDPSDVPVPDVRVDLGGKHTYTDALGMYVLPDAQVQTNRVGLVSFTKDGYADQFKRVELDGGETAGVDVRMAVPDASTNFQDPETLTTMSTPELSVEIPASAVQFEGVTVTTAIDIAIVVGDPTDAVDADMMPGSFLSLQNGGTPLDSVSFFDLTITDSNSGQRYSELAEPIVVELPLPAGLQASYTPGDTIELWSLNEQTGAWVIEGNSTVFDNGGTLWTRSELTHLSWWNVDRPVEQHGCIIGQVVDGNGDPLAGASLIASGVTYNGTSSPVITDATGTGGVTIKNSSTSAEEINLEAKVGLLRIPHPDNPISTPTLAGSCLRNVDCPANCDVLSTPIVVDLGGTVEGTVTRRDGNPAVGFDIITSHGTTATTDANGDYSIPVLIDHPFSVITETYTSADLTATGAAPIVTHDITLLNIAPKLETFTMNAKNTWTYESRGIVYVNGTARPQEPVVFATEFYDDDGDTLTYNWTNASCFDSQQNAIAWTCTPDNEGATTCTPGTSQVGWCEVTLEVDDGYLTEPLQIQVSLWRGEGDSSDTFWWGPG